MKFGGWHTPNANLARTPHLVFGLARRIAVRSTVPIGIVYAEAGTEAIEALIPADAYRPAGLTQLADRAERCLPTTALGRAGEVHELVDVILFLCSDNASFVTGTNHVVDGGRLCMYQPYVAPKDLNK